MSLLQGIVDKKHILLLGIPRTGSTWLGKILSQTLEYSYVHEPDNERHTFYAYYAKQGLARFPFFVANNENKRYRELFNNAFNQSYITYDSVSNQLLKKMVGLTPQIVEQYLQAHGKNPNKNLELARNLGFLLPKQLGNRNNRVVKSVHAILSVDYILSQFTNVQPLFIVRHPAAVIASCLRMNNEDIDRKLYKLPHLQEKYPKLKTIDFTTKSIEFLAGLQIAILYSEIESLLTKYRNAKYIKFEELANSPLETSYQLYKELGIKWTDNVEFFIRESNQKGSGYQTNREANKQADKWRTELDPQQIEAVRKGYQTLGGRAFYTHF